MASDRKEYFQAYYKANKEKIIPKRKAYRDNNKEKLKVGKKASRKTYYLKNKASFILNTDIRRNRIKQHQTPSWADLTEINTIYKQATRRSLIEGIKYHVDHIIPLNGDLVSGLHVQYNLQVIPASLNLSKSNQFAI